jgi:lysozyme
LRTPVSDLKASEPAYEICKHFEAASGAKLKAYLCPAGKPTIGWGHTAGVKLGDTCTLEQAEAWLRQDVANAERLVRRGVKVPLTQWEYDALTSFVFNMRQEKWNEQDCTLLRKLNTGDYLGPVKEFLRWTKAIDPSTKKLVSLGGLVRRRKAERALFSGDPSFRVHLQG